MAKKAGFTKETFASLYQKSEWEGGLSELYASYGNPAEGIDEKFNELFNACKKSQ